MVCSLTVIFQYATSTTASKRGRFRLAKRRLDSKKASFERAALQKAKTLGEGPASLEEKRELENSAGKRNV